MKRYIFQPGWKASVTVCICIAVLLALGSWQVERLQWKKTVLDTIAQRIDAPTVDMPENIMDAQKWDYRHVRITGRFMNDNTFFLIPRHDNDIIGAHVLTPFETDNRILLVNRGFVPEDQVDNINMPTGNLTLSGVLHIPDDKNAFTPLTPDTGRQIYWTDSDAIATRANIKINTPLVLYADADKQKDYPHGGQIRMDIPNNHFQYALFWFGMAGVLLVIYIIFGLKPAKAKNEKN